MILYAVVNLKDQKMFLITDSKSAAQQTANEMGNPEENTILSTSNIDLSNGAQAEVSMSYEESCVEESVRTALRRKGIDEDACPAEFERLAADIAADAYHDMLKYDVDEEYAIDEAMKAHEKEISALLAE